MILGVGVDIVDVARVVRALQRTPALVGRLFTPEEQGLSAESTAARFAAKEALAKALGSPGTLSWLDATVVRGEHGRPEWQVRGAVADRMAELGVTRLHLSLSHDAGVASAFVIAEG